MSLWDFDSIVDYYDANTDVVATSAIRLASLTTDDSAAALRTVASRVRDWVTELRLDRDRFVGLIVSAVDDFYKTIARASTWSENEQQYCAAVFGTLLDLATERDLQVRYVVENAFPDRLDRPLKFYPHAFGNIGMPYVCPHSAAWDLAKESQSIAADEDPTIENLVNVIDEARVVARMASRELLATGRHLAYFEIDWVEGSLDEVLNIDGGPGTLLVFRNEAPTAGSSVQVAVR